MHTYIVTFDYLLFHYILLLWKTIPWLDFKMMCSLFSGMLFLPYYTTILWIYH